MPESFRLSVLTPARAVLEETVESVIAPGTEGYLGILAHHAPLITALQPGKLTVKLPGGEVRTYALSGGFLEVSNNRAVILADALEEPESIDLARARAAAEQARARIKEAAGKGGAEEAAAAEAQDALQRALNRIKVAEEGRG